jgi:hypothetical protein
MKRPGVSIFIVLTGISLPGLPNLPVFAAAATYKCQDASGRVSYSDQPCKGAASTELKTESRPAAPPRPTSTAQPYRRPEPVVVPPLPKVDVSGLPKDEKGNPILTQTPGASIVLVKGKRTAVNVLAACSVLVSRCYKPGERELDACFMSAPRCASERPWEDPAYTPCCPTACWNQYEARRVAGATPLAAFDGALYGGESGSGGCLAVK